MEVKEFWRQFDLADKEHQKWEKRADKVIERYRQEKDNQKESFNILWSNTEVLRPALFSQVPKPDIRRRYRDDDPLAKQGARVLERSLEFIMDDGDFYSFGNSSIMDYLLPGRTVAKIRYVPLMAKTRKAEQLSEIPQLSPLGEQVGSKFFLDDEEVDPAEVEFNESGPFTEREIEEVVDESVVIERWPWKNFRHQKAKRWEDVGWIDYISYLDKKQLRKLFGRKANDIKLTVDASGEGTDRDHKPTHAEVHEVWFKATRETKLAVKGIEDKWMKESTDPLRLSNFYPTARPVMPIDTNDSLSPIPLFTLYQHQANELDTITRRISKLMGALKVVGLYAGSEKNTLQRIFEAEENQYIPVADWSVIAGTGGVSKLIDYLPIEQVGKVLTALFAEREQIVQQIFELTGIADIQRGVSDPRETKGAQVLKAQFGSQRNLTPKQETERYFRDTLRIAAEIVAEHFSSDTIERMTGLAMEIQVQVKPASGDAGPIYETRSVKELLENELQREYSIDIETDSTIAPDEERDKFEMANALEGVSGYLNAVVPLTQAGIPAEPLIKLLKVYLRKFRWGREMEEMLEELERNPPPPQPDPEQIKMQMEMQQKQQEFQMEMQAKAQEFQQKQAEAQIDAQIKMLELEIKRLESQQELRQDQQEHLQELQQMREEHLLKLAQIREEGEAKADAIRTQAQAKDDSTQVSSSS